MKILNAYCGIGGNRTFWGDSHDITAIELDPKIAQIYQDLYPNDTVIVGDAHEHIRLHHNEYDFIWSSIPCQSHSSFRFNINVRFRGTEPVYPDMKLYEEVIFLKYHHKGKFVIENVNPYYTPLIEPSFILQRHLFWSNFYVPPKDFKADNLRKKHDIKQLESHYGYDLSSYKISNKRQVLRNCVHPEIGKYIFDYVEPKEEKPFSLF